MNERWNCDATRALPEGEVRLGEEAEHFLVIRHVGSDVCRDAAATAAIQADWGHALVRDEVNGNADEKTPGAADVSADRAVEVPPTAF